MTAPRRPAASQRSVKDRLPEMTPEDIARLNAENARRKQPRFPLDITATLAAQLLGSGASLATERPQYVEAARRAITLLEVCKEELLRDAEVHATRELFVLQEAVAIEERRRLESLCRDGVVPFGEGLRWMTGQRSLTDAKPRFKEWWKYLHEHPDDFALVRRDIDRDAEADAVGELERSRHDGFEPDRLIAMRTAFDEWYEGIRVPAARAQAGRRGGTTSRRRRNRG